MSILENTSFEQRHQYLSKEDLAAMLTSIGVTDIEELISQCLPSEIRMNSEWNLPKPLSEEKALANLKSLLSQNQVFRSYIGMGYYETSMPSVIVRNILENPGWYTAYTPYQAEISQGRLEMLLNFQTMICGLTGMPIANASLLDEATAAAEAMTVLWAAQKRKRPVPKYIVSTHIHPQTLWLLETRAACLGIEIIKHDFTAQSDIPEGFGILLQFPDTEGNVRDLSTLIAQCHEKQMKVAVATDLLSLCLLRPPGELGADIVLGSTQRFGMGMGFGGPHAAFFAVQEELKRLIPGRIIGISEDSYGKPAYRMALQTREQHIKREKATSNICTAQVLPALLVTAFAIYHGAEGLKKIAKKVHFLTQVLKNSLEKMGFSIPTEYPFDTIKINTESELQAKVRKEAERQKMNFRYCEDGSIGISLSQKTELADVEDIVAAFGKANSSSSVDITALSREDSYIAFPKNLIRNSDFLCQPVFKEHVTEHSLLRYLKTLENKDFSLTSGMIPLGSCTMKLNSTTEMLPLSWSEVSDIHPFAPQEQTKGYQQLIDELGNYLCEITGFSKISFQPNSGAQGEFAGLLSIKRYHKAQGNGHRNIVLIPASAHGTNPASAIMAGLQVVNIKIDTEGDVDLKDLKEKAEKHQENLCGLMVTYPSTHGIFEDSIRTICEIIHKNGGLVYMDGANMNAQLGITSPQLIGADVCHLNLHKTFCIPHGGGGPGMGPIAVNEKLAPFLPNHFIDPSSKGYHSIAATPFGSACLLVISYLFIRMMGAQGLSRAGKQAILNANYIKSILEKDYPIVYKNKNNCVAHEMIIDCRQFKDLGIGAEDIAKRLMDYGFHAPTLSFPINNTLMIEPTESETKAEIDRFARAMQSIRQEIRKIESGEWNKENNPVKNAPHTAELLTKEWAFPYSRTEAVFPLEELKENKIWVSVSRIQNAKGDRNLICTCS